MHAVTQAATGPRSGPHPTGVGDPPEEVPHILQRVTARKVDGIVVPRIDTPEQAQRMIDAVKYCYPDDHGDKVVVIQIESREALDNLDALLALDGIDAYFIGPVDLSKSLGHGGDYRCPPVQAVMDDTIARIRAGGRNAGIVDKTGVVNDPV